MALLLRLLQGNPPTTILDYALTRCYADQYAIHGQTPKVDGTRRGAASILRGREESPQHPGQGSAFRLRPPGQQGFLQFDQRPEGLVDGPAAGGGELD